LISADPKIKGSYDFITFIKNTYPLTEELQINKKNITKDDVLKKLADHTDILIILGHGEANIKYPEYSFIEIFVKNSNSITHKIRISIEDLLMINLSNIELAILIGCETARGKLYQSAGMLSLQQCFLAMGVKNVLASIWKIDAAQAIDQIQDFLYIIKYHDHLYYALRDVQLEAINDLKRSNYYHSPHPYLWGSFVLYSQLN
jgi:CHAT domain-containing protein